MFIIILPIGKINNELYDYKIGTKTIELVNSDREDIFSENNYRRIKLRMFYPISSKGKKYDDLFIDKDIISNLENLSKADKVVINYLKNQKISAYIGKELYSDLKDLPVVIISHKMDYLSEYYIGISEKLASLGYFVVAINHTSMSKFVEINNEIIYFNDINFTIDDFQLNYENDISDVINLIEKINKEDYNYSLDTDEISIVGHGISGGAAINIAFEDNRISNVIVIDPILNNIKKYYDNNYNLLVFKSSEFNSENQLILDDIVKNNNAVVNIYEEKNSISRDYTSLSLISPFSNVLRITKKANIKKIHEIEIEFLKKDWNFIKDIIV